MVWMEKDLNRVKSRTQPLYSSNENRQFTFDELKDRLTPYFRRAMAFKKIKWNCDNTSHEVQKRLEQQPE